jgi:hypothetical protein
VSAIGGQAVLEGVMMRSPSSWAVAVRKPDGEIAQVSRPVSSPMARHRVYRLPIVRGVVALGEALTIGFRALAISAQYASHEEGDDGEVKTEISRGQLIFAFAIAIGFAIMLFKVGPALITSRLGLHTTGTFVIVEGAIRVTIFILYLFLISLLPDLRRVFQYHAAEHKAINAYVNGFESDWRDAYPGINAVQLMELREPPDPRRTELLPVVTYSVKRRIESKQPDYWDYATLLELAMLDSDEQTAMNVLSGGFDTFTLAGWVCVKEPSVTPAPSVVVEP